MAAGLWVVAFAALAPSARALTDCKTLLTACETPWNGFATNPNQAGLCAGLSSFQSCVSRSLATTACRQPAASAEANDASQGRASAIAKFCNKLTGACALTPSCITTTSVMPWDSSSSSGSKPLDSLDSASFHGISSGSNSGSDPSKSADSLNSKASGSWGSYLELWQWSILICLCCCCCGGGGVAVAQNKPKGGKKKPARPPPAPEPLLEPVPAPLPEPAPAPVPVVEEVVVPVIPVVEEVIEPLPGLAPLATTSMAIPSYSMVQAAPYTAPAANYQYMQQPATTSYAAPATYAAPGTTAYSPYGNYGVPTTTAYQAPSTYSGAMFR